MRFKILGGQPVAVVGAMAAGPDAFDIDETARRVGWSRQSLAAIFDASYPLDDVATVGPGELEAVPFPVGRAICGVFQSLREPERAAAGRDDRWRKLAAGLPPAAEPVLLSRSDGQGLPTMAFRDGDELFAAHTFRAVEPGLYDTWALVPR